MSLTHLLKTSRVYCSKRQDHNGSFQSQHFLHGCTRKFTTNSYFLHLQTFFKPLFPQLSFIPMFWPVPTSFTLSKHYNRRVLLSGDIYCQGIIDLSCNEPQGKLTGYILRQIWDEQRKLTRAGFEPATSGLTCRRSNN